MASTAMHREARRPDPREWREPVTSINQVHVSDVAATDLIAHQRDLRLLARRLVDDPSAAEDLVQDTMERALRHRTGLRPHSNLRGWLTTILRNLAVDSSRRRRRLPALESIGPQRDPPATAEASQPRWSCITAGAVRDAVTELDPPFREVLKMHAFESRSYREIAATLGLPKATVGTRLHRARQKLRVLLEHHITST